MINISNLSLKKRLRRQLSAVLGFEMRVDAQLWSTVIRNPALAPDRRSVNALDLLAARLRWFRQDAG